MKKTSIFAFMLFLLLVCCFVHLSLARSVLKINSQQKKLVKTTWRQACIAARMSNHHNGALYPSGN